MPIIALEEHFVIPEVVAAWWALDPAEQDLALPDSTSGESGRRLRELGEDRIAAMDAAGVDVQVISLTSPGVQNLAPATAVALAREADDVLAGAVAAHPDRFAGFATLATPDPEAAAAELQRAVGELGFAGGMLFGRTRERNLDAPEFDPIFATAAALGVPLHLHPQSPRPTVRDAYYDGISDPLDVLFATFGFGWHLETGIQLLRMILGGVFDRHPDLQVIVGHWGEVVLFFLERVAVLEPTAGLERTLAEYVRENVWVAPSGMLSQRYLRWASEVVGVERILMSTDYPFVPTPPGGLARFLSQSSLGDADRAGVAHRNWERLSAGRRG